MGSDVGTEEFERDMELDTERGGEPSAKKTKEWEECRMMTLPFDTVVCITMAIYQGHALRCKSSFKKVRSVIYWMLFRSNMKSEMEGTDGERILAPRVSFRVKPRQIHQPMMV